ncbi:MULTISPECIES: hypothetical protein [unclassified Lonepinella]|uniref:hypothetical protein n=1 Tax=unclassified Lonepinella TaxID=2642006 RepID=UPI0036DF91CF
MAVKRKSHLKKTNKSFAEQIRRTARIRRLRLSKHRIAMRHALVFHSQQES